MSFEVLDLDFVKQTYIHLYKCQIWGYNIYDVFVDIVVDIEEIRKQKKLFFCSEF